MIPIDRDALRTALERSPPVCTAALMNLSEMNEVLSKRVAELEALNAAASTKLLAQGTLLNEIVAFLVSTANDLGVSPKVPDEKDAEMNSHRDMLAVLRKIQGKHNG